MEKYHQLDAKMNKKRKKTIANTQNACVCKRITCGKWKRYYSILELTSVKSFNVYAGELTQIPQVRI